MSLDESGDSSDDGSAFATTNVMLGYASKEPTSDTFSQLGGSPTWPSAGSYPSAELARCKTCTNLTCLLLQLNGDLPDRFAGHERRLYIFACRNKACRKKAGTIRALRGTRISPFSHDETHAETEKQQSVQGSSSSRSLATQPNLGNSIFTPTSPPIALLKNPFTSTFNAGQNPFASNKDSDQDPSAASASQSTFQIDQPKTDSLSNLPATFAAKARIATNHPATVARESWPPESSRPKPYPAYHLDADYETLEPSPPSSSTSRRVMVTEHGTAGKGEDKDVFESSIDKTFQRFANRLAQSPDQVLRYEFQGVPLLYSKNDSIGEILSPAPVKTEANSKVSTRARPSSSGMPACQNCGKPRVFEMQLVPQAIAELEVEETGLDGMEWGTIIVGVCSVDCEEKGIRSGEWGWIEEWAGVQWEEDGQPTKA